MNNLNSVLLEGKLTNHPILTDSTGFCEFTIETHRYYKDNGETKLESFSVNIEASNNLAKTCFDNLEKNSTIRVVGRLGNADSGIKIIAEHVEFKNK